MKNEEFEIIKTNLETRVSNCSKFLDHILTTEDLFGITIKEFVELQRFCKQEQVDMTEILMVDLYHVLGMGKLTVSQMNIFLSLIKKYASYRSDMKCISSMKELSDLPNLPSKSKFHLHKLGDLTLWSTPRGNREAATVLDETAGIGDYHQALFEDKNLLSNSEVSSYKSIVVDQMNISLDVVDAELLITSLNKEASTNTLLKCCQENRSYCGVQWSYANEAHDKISGKILNSGARSNLINLITKLK